MEKQLYIDASHPDETRVILKSENYITQSSFFELIKTIVYIQKKILIFDY